MTVVTNVEQFVVGINRFRDRTVPQTLVLVVKKIALTYLSAVVRATPVRTGRARANWQLTLDVPAAGVLDTVDQSAPVRNGLGKLSLLRAFQNVWISNNLPYAKRLNEGWSKQAPAGMTSVARVQVKAVLGG